MVIVIVLIVFAGVVVFLGGNNEDAARLYYDADFSELYDTSQGDEGRKFKGGQVYTGASAENISTPESSAVPDVADASPVESTEKETSVMSDADADKIAHELYEAFQL